MECELLVDIGGKSEGVVPGNEFESFATVKLGDQFELRIARVKILAARGAPDAAAALIAVTENLNALPTEQRVDVLEAVAAELSRMNDYAGAARLVAQAASIVPNDLQPRLLLLSLGIQGDDKAVIEQALATEGFQLWRTKPKG